MTKRSWELTTLECKPTLLIDQTEPAESRGKLPALPNILLATELGQCEGTESATNFLDTIMEKAVEVDVAVHINHPLTHSLDGNLKYIKLGLVVTPALEILQSVEQGTVNAEDVWYVFGAHGSVEQDKNSLRQCGVIVFDLTCPLVTVSEMPIKKTAVLAREQPNPGVVVYISDKPNILDPSGKQHPELQNAMVNARNMGVSLEISVTGSDPASLLGRIREMGAQTVGLTSQTTNLATQTTAHMDRLAELLSKEPDVETVIRAKPNYVCNAVEVRQNATEELVEQVEILIVMTSSDSRNGRNYVHAARNAKKINPTIPLRAIVVGNSTSEIISGLEQLAVSEESVIGLVASASTMPGNIEHLYETLSGGKSLDSAARTGPESKHKGSIFKPVDNLTRNYLRAFELNG